MCNAAGMSPTLNDDRSRWLILAIELLLRPTACWSFIPLVIAEHASDHGSRATVESGTDLLRCRRWDFIRLHANHRFI